MRSSGDTDGPGPDGDPGANRPDSGDRENLRLPVIGTDEATALLNWWIRGLEGAVQSIDRISIQSSGIYPPALQALHNAQLRLQGIVFRERQRAGM